MVSDFQFLYIFTYILFDPTNSKSVLNNHLSFTITLLHIPASESPSSGWVYVFKGVKTQQILSTICMCRVTIQSTVVNYNCCQCLKYKSVRNVLHFFTTLYLSLPINICISLVFLIRR